MGRLEYHAARRAAYTNPLIVLPEQKPLVGTLFWMQASRRRMVRGTKAAGGNPRPYLRSLAPLCTPMVPA